MDNPPLMTPSTTRTDANSVRTTPSTTDDLYNDKLNIKLSKVFSCTLMANLASEDANLKEVRDCLLTENEERCKPIPPYIHRYQKDLYVKIGCVFVDSMIALPNSIQVLRYKPSMQHIQKLGELCFSCVLAQHASRSSFKYDKCNFCVKIKKKLKLYSFC